MSSYWRQAGEFLRKVAPLFRNRRERTPLDSLERLVEFLGTRSAYVAQKTLYNYVKARMGIRFVAMFEDEQVVSSLNIAKYHVFAACLSDLTVFAVATILHDRPVGNDQRSAMAEHFFRSALRANAADAPAQFAADTSIREFEHRLAETEWRMGARRAEVFVNSPRALLRWAPIAENLKAFDGEIVMNSITYSWRDIREQFHKRLDAAAIFADWSARTGKGETPS